MIERREDLVGIGGVREMAKRYLAESGDLLAVDWSAVDDILIPRIKQYLDGARSGGWRPAGADLPRGEELGLNLFINAVNFCYKDPDTGREYVYVDKSGNMVKRATGLMTALSESGVNWDNFSQVAGLFDRNWFRMVQLSDQNPMYLGGERVRKLRGLADYFLNWGYEDMADLLACCGYDAVALVGFLVESGFFEDEFLKRAQLSARMINDVLVRRGGFLLKGMNNLTVMADYRIPQVFYNLGVVKVADKSLWTKLVTETMIEPGSREERALRATAVVIGAQVARLLGKTEAEVDSDLWGLSQEMVKKGEMKMPHMVVATDAY